MFVETQIGDTTIAKSESTFRGGILGQCLMLGTSGWLSTLVSLHFHLGRLYYILLSEGVGIDSGMLPGEVAAPVNRR